MLEIIIQILAIFLIITGFSLCTIGIGKIIIFILKEEYEASEKEEENNQKKNFN